MLMSTLLNFIILFNYKRLMNPLYQYTSYELAYFIRKKKYNFVEYHGIFNLNQPCFSDSSASLRYKQNKTHTYNLHNHNMNSELDCKISKLFFNSDQSFFSEFIALKTLILMLGTCNLLNKFKLKNNLFLFQVYSLIGTILTGNYLPYQYCDNTIHPNLTTYPSCPPTLSPPPAHSQHIVYTLI